MDTFKFDDLDYTLMKKLFTIEGDCIIFPFPEVTKQSAFNFMLTAGDKLASIAKRLNLRAAIAQGREKDYEFLASLAKLSSDACNDCIVDTPVNLSSKNNSFSIPISNTSKNFSSNVKKENPMSDIIIDPRNTPVAPEIEISWDHCWNSPDAMWVIHQATQKVLYANPAAYKANADKPPTEVLNTEINVLWEDEALDNLTRLVNKLNPNKWLEGHSNRGFRWARNTQEGGVIYTRRRHEFHVDYKKITYLGLECRFEHVKAAIPV